MSYSQSNLVEYVDFNTLVGTTDSTNVNEFNAIWGVGVGDKGYGQTAISIVDQGDTVGATEWSSLITKSSNVAVHQGTSYTSITAPVSGATVAFSSGLPTNLTSIFTNRRNAAAQGTTAVTTTTNSTTWSSALTFTHTITFESGDKARYFFNAGGQIAINVSHPDGINANRMFNAMAAACGTIVLSGHTSGQITVAGTNYTGLDKIAGQPGVISFNQNLGYFGLTTVNQLGYKQGVATAYHQYTSSYISMSLKTNGTQGVNGDNGNVITITTVWEEIPTGLTVSSGTATAVTVRPPSTAKLTNTWGTVTVAGSVTGN